MLKTFKNAQKGFTLIELLVVIAIIGILSGIVVTSLGGQRARARDSRRVSEIQSAALGLQLYFDSNNRYPADLDDLVTAGLIAKNLRDPSTAAKYLYNGYTTSSWVAGTAAVAAGAGGIQTACPTSGSTCQGFHVAADLETNDANLMSGSDNIAASGTNATISGGAGKSCDGTTDATKACYDQKNH